MDDPNEAERGARGSETILVVDDVEGFREMAREFLEFFGYRVVVASDGINALAAIEGLDGPVHLLLSDVVMPAVSGRDLAETLQRTRPGLRVLFMSGYNEERVARDGVLEGGIAFIGKPFTPLGLARKVREVLDNPA